VTILTYAERQAHWEWCREFIDREAIYRVDDTHPMLPGKNPKGRYTFQYYLRRATFNPHFAHALGLLFWDHFLPVYWPPPPLPRPPRFSAKTSGCLTWLQSFARSTPPCFDRRLPSCRAGLANVSGTELKLTVGEGRRSQEPSRDPPEALSFKEAGAFLLAPRGSIRRVAHRHGCMPHTC
jgi:hypothetical protein